MRVSFDLTSNAEKAYEKQNNGEYAIAEYIVTQPQRFGHMIVEVEIPGHPSLLLQKDSMIVCGNIGNGDNARRSLRASTWNANIASMDITYVNIAHKRWKSHTAFFAST